LTLGLVLAEAGRIAGMQVSWLPSYGPEMRGGTAHCHVCISRRPVGSPLITRPNVVFAMNRPSIERFQGELERGGLLIYNAAMAGETSIRSDIEAIGVPANDLAASVDAPKAVNMVMLGAFLEASGVLAAEAWRGALGTIFTKPAVAEANRRAVAAGAEHARTVRTACGSPICVTPAKAGVHR
jgi:2-oxoglutarate ferredoxin oxidoreductase subunit gamma